MNGGKDVFIFISNVARYSKVDLSVSLHFPLASKDYQSGSNITHPGKRMLAGPLSVIIPNKYDFIFN